ncbi:NADH-FMN oxidoreductase RutF, flavin reductase (DIM6/NTAB) family [Sporobacter termitidis DSM 10068]|uniref:NADH-FMN oxidoreductase RutF, flavin reductase (DIM6/NTAB) family n=1 Tax=Sporobacter termitidis DSM 10068 TaxID=1123282 RepID=A0A1M5W5Z9_9FIRM|nr:flavin reductase [Sporobacter termitidis]SHH82916.1 NADH-FMN oxidoreductase RutF, flavin reductase (DIM6/NTAB) family [Sporobacter termitidis DSM 10068]
MNNKAMYKLVYGLHLLTSLEGGRDNGCIINTAVQVTTSPNRMTLAVNKQNLTHDMILKTGAFNVSTLSEDAPFSLFQNFGMQSGKAADKFAGFDDAYRSENGLLYLTKYANSFISGKVLTATDIGTHTLFLADVADAEVLSNAESMSYAYYQKNVKPSAPRTAAKGWRCRVCGYVYEGDELPPDFICPVCKHGASDFERIE